MSENQPYVTMLDDRKIPQLGFGTYKSAPSEVEEAVAHALDTGYRHIDTAKLYENEEGVGRAVREHSVPREDVFVTTKVWNDDHGYDSTLRAFDASLERLGLDYVDLYLIHWPMPMNGLTVDTWKALVHLQEQGLAKSIGVSNFPAHRIDEIVDSTGVRPVLNQIELHPYFNQSALRVENNKRGILTEAWAPLSRGGELFEDATIDEIARAHGATPAQVVLAWHLALGNVVIPKSVTPSRIVENFGALTVQLTAEDIERINQLDRGEAARTGFDPETMIRPGDN